MKIFILTVLLFLGACSNPGVVQISPDSYVLFREDHGGVFGNGGALRAEVIADANAFAASKGKLAIPISSDFTPMKQCVACWASFEYQFRVVDSDDEEAVRTSLRKRADVVEEKNITKTIKGGQHTDVYTQLLKLNDLLEKKIISEDEFQEMKVKILKRSK